MRIKLNYIAPLLATGAAAVAIAAAPTAAAQSCDYVGGGFTDSQCQSPGNVQINDAPPPITSSGVGPYGPFFSYDRGHRG
jgi:hypothetical protein